MENNPLQADIIAEARDATAEAWNLLESLDWYMARPHLERALAALDRTNDRQRRARMMERAERA